MKFFTLLIANLLFILGCVSLFAYLLAMRWHYLLPIELFWLSIILMIVSVLFQILKAELKSSFCIFLVLEISLISVLLHMIYQIPTYGLYGTDVYGDMASAKSIFFTGFIASNAQYTTYYSSFPVIHILGASVSMLTGIDLFSVVKWLPSIIDAFLTPLCYLLVRYSFKNEKVALLSALSFAFIQNHILFSSLFVRETCALVLSVSCIYLYFSSSGSRNPRGRLSLSIFFLILTIFAHHLTSFFLVIFLICHYTLTRLIKPRFVNFRNMLSFTGKLTASFLLLSCVVLFAYWLFIASSQSVMSPIDVMASSIQKLLDISSWGNNSYASTSGISGSLIQTIRGYILFIGFYSLLFAFSIIILYGFFKKSKQKPFEYFSYSIFLFLCLIIGFFSLYVITPAAFPDRFLVYGWLFGFGPLTFVITQLKNKSFKTLCFSLLFAFMLLNVYMIQPSLWDPNSPEIVTAPTLQDYALPDAIDFSIGTIVGDANSLMAIYDKSSNLGTLYLSSQTDLKRYDWIIIDQSNPANQTLSSFSISNGYNRIYDSGMLSVERTHNELQNITGHWESLWW